MKSYTKKDLMEFLDHAESKSLMPKNTVVAYRAACNAILAAMDDEDTDLSQADFETLFIRFNNRDRLKYKPQTLRDYQNKFNTLNKEYQAFDENPDSWKPAAAQRSTNPGKNSKRKPTANVKSVSLPTDQTSGQLAASFSSAPPQAHDIVHQFPLRNNVVVKVTGIPFDVKKSEMGRLTAFLSNLVPQEDEVPAQLQMLPEPE